MGERNAETVSPASPVLDGAPTTRRREVAWDAGSARDVCSQILAPLGRLEERAATFGADDIGRVVASPARVPHHVCVNEIVVSGLLNGIYPPDSAHPGPVRLPSRQLPARPGQISRGPGGMT